MQPDTRKNRIKTALFGALTGAAAFLLIYTAIPLNVSDDSWIMRGYVERDIIQHYTGWLQYRAGAETFPFGVSPNISYPDGGAVAFTDSVPIASILMRPVSLLFSGTFQFFGIYTLLCFMLAGAFAALLLGLFIDRTVPLLLGTALFTVSPVMLERAFRHVALTSHFLILAALLLYFRNRREGFRFRLGYILLSALAAAIHFYFVPMVLAVIFADLLQELLNEKKRRREKSSDRRGGLFPKLLLFLAGNLAAVLCSVFLIGYFYAPTVQSGAAGYGYFTMNLNTLFYPVSVSGIVWSRALPSAAGQGLGSAEGFNYLGLGVLLALALAGGIAAAKKQLGSVLAAVRRHIGLAAVSVILTVFAVSTTLIINDSVYPLIVLPDPLLKLFSVFRSSGRLFWPVNYLLLLLAAVSLYRMFRGAGKKWIAPAGMALLCAVQLFDLSPALAAKRRSFTEPAAGFENTVKNAFFETNSAAFSEIFTFSDAGTVMGMYLSHYAAENGMVTNEPFSARNNLAAYHARGDAEYAALMDGKIDPKKLYIFDTQSLAAQNRFFDAAERLGDSVYAGKLRGIYYVLFSKESGGRAAEDPLFTPFSEIPFAIADHSDGSWNRGVLAADPQTVIFYDNAFTRRILENAEYITAESGRYRILQKDCRDTGWVMVRLDIPDGSLLIEKELSAE